MRTLKLLTMLAVMGTIAFSVMAYDIVKKTIFADAKNIVHTTATISENVLDKDADVAPAEYSSGSIELVLQGHSKLDFTDESGKARSVVFNFGFRRMPESGVVKIMYDSKKINHISVDGFDYVDYVGCGLAVLAALGSLALGVLFIIILVIKHLSNELSFYRREKRVYHRDISGVGYIFACKIFCLIFFVAGVILSVVSLYNIGKMAVNVPLAKTDKCEKTVADTYINEQSGSTAYVFTAQNGMTFTNAILQENEKFITDGKVKVRYLKNDPSQNSIDNMFVYMPQSSPWLYKLAAGLICFIAAVVALVLAILLEFIFKRILRKRGYVDYFKSKDENFFVETEDYSDMQ